MISKLARNLQPISTKSRRGNRSSPSGFSVKKETNSSKSGLRLKSGAIGGHHKCNHQWHTHRKNCPWCPARSPSPCRWYFSLPLRLPGQTLVDYSASQCFGQRGLQLGPGDWQPEPWPPLSSRQPAEWPLVRPLGFAWSLTRLPRAIARPPSIAARPIYAADPFPGARPPYPSPG